MATTPPSPANRAGVPPIALGMVLGGVTSIQFGAALATTLFDEVGPAGTSILRLGFAAAILLVLWRPRVRGRSAADLRLALAYGLALGAMNLLFYESIDRIPLGIAVTFEFIGPLGVAIAGSRRAVDGLWVLLAAAGILLLSGLGGVGTGDLDTIGIIMALTAGGFWALYIVLAARAGRAFAGSEGVTLAMVVAALVPLGPGIAQGGGDLLDPRLIALGAGVAVLSSVIPYSLETEALRRMPQHVFGVLMSLEPGVAALAGFVVLGQSLRTREAVAIGLVVAASIGASRYASRPAAPAEP